ncbi:hypothetical protein SteCoe_35519 [Stentor coeruleus]|uniref:Uncharacterized protein n=1 Tax=Stentor coeruleus TaxID=5963 RepID=A0A1R2AS43_9CILI|nr:hypothetical protein SteCoe_35519 [Stentor coeruleus]
MSNQVITEITVNLGEVPSSPGFKVAARLGLGLANSENIKNTFREKTSQDLNELTLYIVISAKSAEGAEEIRQTIHNSIEKFNSDEELDPVLTKLRQFIAKSDDEDFKGTAKFVWTVEVLESTVIVKATPIAQLREIATTQLGMAIELAYCLFKLNSEVYFELDMGKAISELATSENWIKDVFDTLCLRLRIHLHADFFINYGELARERGAPEKILMLFGGLGLFHSANLNFNFRSSSELPDNLKEGLAKISSQGAGSRFHKDIPENMKKFFGHFANAGSGNLHVFAGFQTNVLHAELHVPGLSKFLAQ